jgi:glucose-6-phosphate isomerase
MLFENKVLSYKSYINDFTPDIYKDFDLKSNKIGLQKKVQDLFKGKNVNYTEALAAWHPKYRNEYPLVNSKTKYLDLFNSSTNIVVIGIGGSFEGPKLLIESIGNTVSNYIFITGSDSDEFKEKISKLQPTETIFVVSSKSFTTKETIETLNNAIAWSRDMSKFLAITSNKTEALKYNIKNIVEFDKEIGGRYSIWSDISLPAEWENNTELKENFIMGGKQADIDLQNNNNNYFKFVKTLSFSDIWLHNFKNKSSRVVLSYIWKFRSFPDYVQQLEMESLGKQPSEESEYKKTGQIIFGGYGPTAQHSYFQLLHQGTQDICADIIVSMQDPKSLVYAQAITQSELLSNGVDNSFKEEEKINGDVPLNLFLLKNIDSYSLGYLIATWEHRTYITAVMLGINPFDQFGVNAGKIFTEKYLKENGG